MQEVSSVDFSRSCFTSSSSKAILRALQKAGSAKAGEILASIDRADWSGVVGVGIDHGSYMDSESFSLDYLAVSLLKKYPEFKLGIDTADVAIQSFLASESSCSKVNESIVRPELAPSIGVSRESYIHTARRKISSLLGEFSWDSAALHFGFSGGASTRLKRKSGAPYYKYQGKPETTRNNAVAAICAIRSIPLWAEQMASLYGQDPRNWVEVVEGSRITTVAKSAKTDRVIAIEPCMNMFIQRGVGHLIRTSLRSVGIDLNDQTRNQILAREGSADDSLTTIDLASASDSISLELVKLLLPNDWFDAMCVCRSEVGILPNGIKHRFAKISSMGNGFTFELESLIFWALSKSVVDLLEVSDRRVGIYGDDIIVSKDAAGSLIDVLLYCGFKTNVDKTFLEGPFRESCGKHYFHGHDVTPFYIKTPVETLERQFWIVNTVRMWTSDRWHPELYQKLYNYLVKSIQQKHRYLVPMSLGSEAGIWASFDEAHPTFSRWNQMFSLKRLTARRSKHSPNGYAAVLHWFNGAVDFDSPSVMKGSSSGIQLEKGEVAYFHSRQYVPWWDSAPCGVVLPRKLL